MEINIMNYIGTKCISSDGYECEIIERMTFDKSPSSCKYKVKFVDGLEGVWAYPTLKQSDFRYESRERNYIGANFKSSDGYECKIIKQITFDTMPSKCMYQVLFSDGYKSDFNLGTLRSRQFRRHRLYRGIIGKSFFSKDNYEFSVIKNLTGDKMPSQSTYEIKFKDGYVTKAGYNSIVNQSISRYVRINLIGNKYISQDGYNFRVISLIKSGRTTRESKFLIRFEDGNEQEVTGRSIIDNTVKFLLDLIGQVFRSKDGYLCTIIRQVDSKSKLHACKYEVLFEDNTTAVHTYNTLLYGTFIKNRKVNYVGKKFTSTDGFVCEVISQDGDNCIVKYEDNLIKNYKRDTLVSGRFKKGNGDIIGKTFVSRDGCNIKVLKQTTFDNVLSLCRFEVERSDGLKFELSYQTIKNIPKYCYKHRKNYNIGGLFKSADNYKCKIFEQVIEKNSNNESYYGVVFEDGFKDIKRVGNQFYKINQRDFIKIDFDNNNIDKFHLCTCNKCGMTNLLTYDEIYEHKKSHILHDINE